MLQEFDLLFSSPKAKKSMVFAELISSLPRVSADPVALDSLPDEPLFLIELTDPWYRYILIYLKTQCL